MRVPLGRTPGLRPCQATPQPCFTEFRINFYSPILWVPKPGKLGRLWGLYGQHQGWSPLLWPFQASKCCQVCKVGVPKAPRTEPGDVAGKGSKEEGRWAGLGSNSRRGSEPGGPDSLDILISTKPPKFFVAENPKDSSGRQNVNRASLRTGEALVCGEASSQDLTSDKPRATQFPGDHQGRGAAAEGLSSPAQSEDSERLAAAPWSPAPRIPPTAQSGAVTIF